MIPTTTHESRDGATRLHEVWPNGFYCGPSVIAAVTGADCREVRGWINSVRHRRPNQGVLRMQNRELIGTFASRGYSLISLDVPQPARQGPIVRRWAYGERPIFENFAANFEAGVRYIVNVTGHYVAILDGIVFDNQCRFGCDITKHKSRRMRVHQAWRIA